MHECPECQSACSCDMEDMWGEAPEDCNHICPLGDDDDDWDDEWCDAHDENNKESNA